jgi:allantoin racemase
LIHATRSGGTTVLVKIINPNTTISMTQRIGECARAVAAVGTEISAVSPSMGPASIESHYDEALSVPGLLEEIERGEREGADGYVIACFGDPGLDAARELAVGPVVGIAEAAMHAASFLGRGFSVVTTLGRTTGRAWDLAGRYGMSRTCRNVRACEIPVLELEQPGSRARELIMQECRLALLEDRSDVIVLGCAGMADLTAEISATLGVPVVDGVAAATKMVESLVAMGLRTSAWSEFAPPPAKKYVGLLSEFAVL